MEEPPTTFDNPPEPPDYVDVNAGSSFELDAEIESHVESVEMRDAEQFSDRVERTHRGPRQTRRHSRRAQRRPSRQRRPDRDDTDEQDEQPRGRFGSPRVGLLLTVALTVISFISVVVLFATNAGAPTAPPAIDTTPRKPTTDSYISIQPAPPPPTIPPVKQTPLRLPKRSSY
jgi:hypothetical protein